MWAVFGEAQRRNVKVMESGVNQRTCCLTSYSSRPASMNWAMRVSCCFASTRYDDSSLASLLIAVPHPSSTVNVEISITVETLHSSRDELGDGKGSKRVQCNAYRFTTPVLIVN